MAKIKNDPIGYITREIRAPVRKAGLSRPEEKVEDRTFFTAPLSARLYLDLRGKKKPSKKTK